MARCAAKDNRAIVRAASQASKAADYLLGCIPDEHFTMGALSYLMSQPRLSRDRAEIELTPMRIGIALTGAGKL